MLRMCVETHSYAHDATLPKMQRENRALVGKKNFGRTRVVNAITVYNRADDLYAANWQRARKR